MPSGGAGTRAARTMPSAALSSRSLPDDPVTLAETMAPDELTTKLTRTVPRMPRTAPARRAIAALTALFQRDGSIFGALDEAEERTDAGGCLATRLGRSAGFLSLTISGFLGAASLGAGFLRSTFF